MTNNNHLPPIFVEWQECRNSIDRFDKIIVDLRKYGFTLITGLLTADAFLFFTLPKVSTSGQIGISIMMMILVFALFVVDRYHEVFLLGAVATAERLENHQIFNGGLSCTIRQQSRAGRTDTSGTLLYSLFIICSAIPMITTNIGTLQSSNDLLISVFFMSLFIFMILLYNHRTRPRININPIPEVPNSL